MFYVISYCICFQDSLWVILLSSTRIATRTITAHKMPDISFPPIFYTTSRKNNQFKITILRVTKFHSIKNILFLWLINFSWYCYFQKKDYFSPHKRESITVVDYWNSMEVICYTFFRKKKQHALKVTSDFGRLWIVKIMLTSHFGVCERKWSQLPLIRQCFLFKSWL